MFYSQFLLSKKGHLGAILLAAYCFKRLKKQQVTETDIASSVDKILADEVPSVTYRILAYLLLGVVRIYSKKVEHLFHDCHDIITAMNKHFGKQIISPSKQKRAPQFSIRLPKRFELDTFVLEPANYLSGVHVAEDEDIVLHETWINDGVAEVSLGKKREASATQTSAEATLLQNETCTSSHVPPEFFAEQGNGSSIHTPPHEVLSPRRLENYAEVTSPHTERNLAGSIEELRDIRFSRDECADFEMFYRANSGDPVINIPTSEPNPDAELDLSAEKVVSECADFEMFRAANIEDNIPSSGPNPDAETGHLTERLVSEGHDALEVKEVGSTSRALDAGKLKETPSTRDGTHGSVVQDVKDGDSPRYMAIQTPAIIEREGVKGSAKRKCIVVGVTALEKERVKGSAKRKCIVDGATVLSNRALKRNIDDVSDLVRKRRKVPHTLLDIWRFSYIPDLADNFLKPIIPCVVVGYTESFCRKRLNNKSPVEVAKAPSAPEEIIPPKSIEPSEAAEACAPEVIIPPMSPDGRSAIAPATPVLYSMPNRLSQGRRTSDSDGEGPMNSYEGVRLNGTDEVTSLEVDTLETNLMDEILLSTNSTSLQEVEENEGNGREPYVWTAKTRAVARYLQRSITHQRQQKMEEAVRLSKLLHKKPKRESARVFYEILVLKSGGFIDLQQRRPYDDIVIRETDKMEETLRSC